MKKVWFTFTGRGHPGQTHSKNLDKLKEKNTGSPKVNDSQINYDFNEKYMIDGHIVFVFFSYHTAEVSLM